MSDHPTTEADPDAACEEFASAMDAYRWRSGRMFPTWSEVLEVLKDLGYRKPDDAPGPSDGMPLSDAPRYLIQIDAANQPELLDRIASAIESRGGHTARPTAPQTYAFPTESARDSALDALRHAFGWSSVRTA